MLGSYPVDVMLLATDLGVARRFYGDTLGLPLLLEDTQFLTFGCGGNSRLVVTKSTTGTREEATKASWRVEDLAAEVAELQARGVQLQDLPELGTVDGIADLGFALAAWSIDPHHNWIGLLQLKDPGVQPPAPQPAPGRRRLARPGSRGGGEPAHGRCRWADRRWADRRQAAGIAHHRAPPATRRSGRQGRGGDMKATAPRTGPDPRRWWALALLCGAFLMVLLDATIVLVALPSIGADLGFSEQGLQWVLSAYALTFGGLLLLGELGSTAAYSAVPATDILLTGLGCRVECS